MDRESEITAHDVGNGLNKPEMSPYIFPARNHPKPVFEIDDLPECIPIDVPIASGYADMTNRNNQAMSAGEIGRILSSGDATMGIDKVSLYLSPFMVRLENRYEWDEFPLHNNDRPGLVWKTKRVISTGHLVDVFLRQPADGTQSFMCTTFNPSEAGPLVSVKDTLTIAEVALRDLDELVCIVEPFEKVRIGRVDITADFSPVADMDAVRALVRSSSARARWGTREFVSSGGNRGWTIEHFTKHRGKAMVYDKSAEQGIPIPTVRFEARVEKDARKQWGLRMLGDLTEDAARAVLLHYMEPFIDALTTAGSITGALAAFRPRIVHEAIGAMLCEENGVPIPIDRSRRRAHREVMKALGISNTRDLVIDGRRASKRKLRSRKP